MYGTEITFENQSMLSSIGKSYQKLKAKRFDKIVLLMAKGHG